MTNSDGIELVEKILCDESNLAIFKKMLLNIARENLHYTPEQAEVQVDSLVLLLSEKIACPVKDKREKLKFITDCE